MARIQCAAHFHVTVSNKMKLKYMYNTHEMGVLEKVEDGYQYTSNAHNEETLLNQGVLMRNEYGLWGSQKRTSNMLFAEFQEFLAETTRRDILRRAEITADDSDWERLVKLSRLQYFPRDFYVQIVEEEQ